MNKTKLMQKIEERFGENLEEKLRRSYLDEKINTVEIAKELGVNDSTVGRWLRMYSIDIRSFSEARLPVGFVVPAKEELERIYVNERVSSSRIAKKFGVSNSTVRRWLDTYGIKIRNLSETQLPVGFVKPTKEELERMYWREGMSTTDISKKLGISYMTVGRWLNENGIRIRHNSEARLPVGFVVPAKEELERMYLKEGKNTREIGEKFGVHACTIGMWVKKYGIKIRNTSEAHLPAGVVKPTKEELERMYWREGMSTVDISEKLGVSGNVILNWLENYGIKKRGKLEALLPVGFVMPTKEELERMYLRESMSTVDIGEKFGVSNPTVGNWLKTYGIKIRNKAGIYEDKDLRKKCIDELLEITGKMAEELITTDFVKKKKDGISCMGVLGWYKREYNCNAAAARDILIQDLFGIKNLSAEEKLDKETQQLEKLLEGYANEKNQTNAGN